MYARFVTLVIKPGMGAAFERFYAAELAPALRENEGCLFAHLTQSVQREDEFVSLTFWQSREHAEAYEDQGRYAALLERNKPFLADSSEWRMQLSDDMTLSYQPVEQEPEVERFEVAAGTASAPDPDRVADMYLRIVAVRPNPKLMDGLRAVYSDVIAPALAATDGCRYAYMVEGRDANEVLSVTLWDSKAHADRYEASGEFDRLMDAARPMLSSLSSMTEWNMALGTSRSTRTTTSDDVQVEGFRLTGRSPDKG